LRSRFFIRFKIKKSRIFPEEYRYNFELLSFEYLLYGAPGGPVGIFIEDEKHFVCRGNFSEKLGKTGKKVIPHQGLLGVDMMGVTAGTG
jgi:hypothetical protein